MTRLARCSDCRSTIPRRELARIAERLQAVGDGRKRVLCDSCTGRLLRLDHAAAATLVVQAEGNLIDVQGRCQTAIADAESWLAEARRRLRIADKHHVGSRNE